MLYKRNEKNILFLYEVGHVEALVRFLEENPSIKEEGYLLLSLDAEVEDALAEKGFSFESARHYKTPDIATAVVNSEWTDSVFDSDRWAFFFYRGVSLGAIYRLSLQWYISHLLYYIDIVSAVVANNPETRILVVFPPIGGRPPMGSTLVGFTVDAIVDAVSRVAEEHEMGVLVPITLQSDVRDKSASVSYFFFKRAMFSFCIRLFNLFISIVRRPRRVRILSSDYWKYLEPYVENLESAEIILIDRLQGLKAGFSNIWRFRMRFMHIDEFSSGSSKQREKALEHYLQEWESIKSESELPQFVFRKCSLRPIISRVLDVVMSEVGNKILKDIDSAFEMINTLKPDIVELRSTISTQTHFMILAQVARVIGVPSIEMQHGLEPVWLDARHLTEFFGVYGPHIQEKMRVSGDTGTTPIVIGSPRFDVYASLKKEKSSEYSQLASDVFTCLCISPAVYPGGDYDSYEIEEFYSVIASAMKKIPNSRTIIKFRPGPSRDTFVRNRIESYFAGMSYVIMQLEPLSGVFPKADVVVSCYSTSVLEALQCDKPLIYLGIAPVRQLEGLDQFTAYQEQGAMRIATNKEDLSRMLVELAGNPDARRRLSEGAADFLEREFAFDGHASERAAQLIESLAAGER